LYTAYMYVQLIVTVSRGPFCKPIGKPSVTKSPAEVRFACSHDSWQSSLDTRITGPVYLVCLLLLACSCDHGVILRACMQGNSTASANAVSMALSQGAPATAISQAVAQVVSHMSTQLLIQLLLLMANLT